MGEIKRSLDLIVTLQSIRRVCDECLRDRGDPAAAVRAVLPMTEAGNGLVHEMRPFAPGLGDMWDTLRAILVVAGQIGPAPWDAGGGGSDAGVRAAVSAPARVGRAVPGRGSGLAGDDAPPDPDD